MNSIAIALGNKDLAPIDNRDSAYQYKPPSTNNPLQPWLDALTLESDFNLDQWFTDQGITDPAAKTYYNYARLRGISGRSDVMQFEQHLWKKGINPYTWAPATSSFVTAPQNSAGLGVAPNGGLYNDASIRALVNQDSRTLLKGSGSVEDQTTAQANQPSVGSKSTMSAAQVAAMQSPSQGGIAWSEIDPRDDAYRNMRGAVGALGLTDFTLNTNPQAPGYLPYRIIDGKKVYTVTQPGITPAPVLAQSITPAAAIPRISANIDDPVTSSMNMIAKTLGITNFGAPGSNFTPQTAEAVKVVPTTSVSAAKSSVSPASYMLNNKGQGFNLQQWFSDQGVTNTDQMNYANYAAIRGLDPYRRATFSPDLRTVNYGGVLDSFDTPKQAPAPNMNLAPLNSVNTPLNLPNVNYRYNTPTAVPSRQLPNSARTAIHRSRGQQGGDVTGLDDGSSQTDRNMLLLARPTLLG